MGFFEMFALGLGVIAVGKSEYSKSSDPKASWNAAANAIVTTPRMMQMGPACRPSTFATKSNNMVSQNAV